MLQLTDHCIVNQMRPEDLELAIKKLHVLDQRFLTYRSRPKIG